MDAVKGVDISVFNGDVDFAALTRAGIRFTILRCGFGRDYPGQQDSQFEANVRKAEAAGMPWGAYHYSYARDAAGALREAQHALRLLNGRKPAYGVWFDMEDSSTIGGDLAGAAQTFCSVMEDHGLYAGVYANIYWFNNYLTAPVFDRFDRWCAQYNSVCQLTKPYGMWQYTDRLVIGGKVFDGDLAYRDYPALTQKEEEEMLTYEQFKEYVERYLRELESLPASRWAEPAIELCKREGLMGGDDDGRFRPQSCLTREEAAQVAANLFLRLQK